MGSATNSKNIQLLLIDPQNDFVDQPGAALPVPGALEDMKRLAVMIERILPKISDIRVSLDSHQRVHIAHPIWWIDRNGKHPNPFTQITLKMVEGPDPEYRSYLPDGTIKWRTRSVQYVKDLEARGRNKLTIWPSHCEIGSFGFSIHPILDKALGLFKDEFATVDYVTKGSNIWTEHFSILQADVPDPQDHGTLPNMELVGRLEPADMIIVGGQALSHCLRWSVMDIADKFGPDQVKKFVLLTDGTSSVPGFEQDSEKFIREMRDRGMQLSTTADILK